MKKQLTVLAALLCLHGHGAAAQSGAGADLSITVDASAEAVMTGSEVVYTLTVTNEGPDAAFNVRVDDTLPAETAFVSCAASGGGACEGEGNARTVVFPGIAADTSETVTLVARVNCAVEDGEEIANTGTVRSPTPDPAGPEADNETVFIDAVNPLPVIVNASATPSLLWPPNHQMASVTVDYEIVDNCGPVEVDLQVTSNEVVDGTGDGHTSPDWLVIDANHVQLRAERSGGGSGRLYSVTITAVDGANQSGAAAVDVRVPHDRRH
jgi:uncharacterized repeat protein (TIGR01451 family)